MTLHPLPILPTLLCLFFLASPGMAGNSEELITLLTQDIARSGSAEEKGTLHVYRARQYLKTREWDQAEKDYNTALELSHKGWIHLERGHFFMGRRKYELAFEEARAAKEEVPTLAPEADEIMETALEGIEKNYLAENPPTIIMDRKVDSKRKTRFDVMRSAGKSNPPGQPRTVTVQQQTRARKVYRKPKG